LWWWEEHLSDASFVVTEGADDITGALLAWPDESPVAWVRLAALDYTLSVDTWLELSLPLVLDGLRRQNARYLAWMDYGGWAEPHLKMHGFEPLEQVMTLIKADQVLPPRAADAVHIRPASDADIPLVIAIDRAAFTPHWWHSASTLRRQGMAASHFAIAQVQDAVVGYIEAKVQPPMAHVNRIAVHPAHQGSGVGAALLRDALRAFWQRGVRHVSLNTQTANLPSRQLYQRFGFEPTGEVVQAWLQEV